MATIDEIADKFALDEVFSEYPTDATIDDLEEVANACEDFFSHDDWLICADYEQYAYISAGAIMQLVCDKAWTFKRYYEMVGA